MVGLRNSLSVCEFVAFLPRTTRISNTTLLNQIQKWLVSTKLDQSSQNLRREEGGDGGGGEMNIKKMLFFLMTIRYSIFNTCLLSVFFHPTLSYGVSKAVSNMPEELQQKLSLHHHHQQQQHHHHLQQQQHQQQHSSHQQVSPQQSGRGRRASGLLSPVERGSRTLRLQPPPHLPPSVFLFFMIQHPKFL